MSDILIIDDDGRGAETLAALLRDAGHESRFAGSAGGALSQLRQQEPELILLDLSMPRVDGMELLEALRDEPQFAHVPIVVLSGRTEPEVIDRARKLGATDYLVKGQDWDEMYRRIQASLPTSGVA